jgi:hypothetical protein
VFRTPGTGMDGMVGHVFFGIVMREIDRDDGEKN